jgi:hypothetical protein
MQATGLSFSVSVEVSESAVGLRRHFHCCVRTMSLVAAESVLSATEYSLAGECAGDSILEAGGVCAEVDRKTTRLLDTQCTAIYTMAFLTHTRTSQTIALA